MGLQVRSSSSEVQPCPVAVVKKFVAQGQHKAGSKLFRQVQHTRNGWKLKEQGMSYSRANELLKKELKKEGLDSKQYSVHSLRSGGASAAAALGVSDRLFQRHGGWRSEAARNNYLRETLNSLLLVTKAMQRQGYRFLSMCFCFAGEASLTAVCVKCNFLPAEERKRQKMFFTHAAKGIGPSSQGGKVSFLFCHACLTKNLTHPPTQGSYTVVGTVNCNTTGTLTQYKTSVNG